MTEEKLPGTEDSFWITETIVNEFLYSVSMSRSADHRVSPMGQAPDIEKRCYQTPGLI
jgi:hypothetical protein